MKSPIIWSDANDVIDIIAPINVNRVERFKGISRYLKQNSSMQGAKKQI